MNPKQFSPPALSLLRAFCHRTFLVVLAAGVIVSYSRAAEASGTWKSTVTTQNGQTIETTLKLTQAGEKVTGVIIRDGTEIAIENGAMKGDELSFDVTRERNGQKMTTKVTGNVDASSIKGKIEFERDGKKRTREWEAVREGGTPAKKTPEGANGTWKYSLKITDDNQIDLSVVLKQDGGQLTGAIKFGDTEAPISDGKIKENQLSFKVVRERDGQTYTSKYQGTQDGNSIKGKIDSDWGGRNRVFDWNARRE